MGRKDMHRRAAVMWDFLYKQSTQCRHMHSYGQYTCVIKDKERPWMHSNVCLWGGSGWDRRRKDWEPEFHYEVPWLLLGGKKPHPNPKP